MTKNKNIFIYSLAFFCLLTTYLIFPGQAQGQLNATSERYLQMDFDQIDLKDFIKFVSDLTNKNFIIEQKVTGKVSVVSPTKITVDEAYKVFLSVLEVHGYTTIPSGNVIKIVRAVEARQKNVQTDVGKINTSDPSDSFITQIIPLNFASPQKLQKILRPMVSKQGLLVSYEPTNILILTDYHSNIQRMLNIVNQVDINTFKDSLNVIPLKNARAKNLTENLQKLLNKNEQAGKLIHSGTVNIVPDERTNSILIMAQKDNLHQLKTIISKLDKPTPEDISDMQLKVIHLENAKAEELSKILSSLIGGKDSSKGKTIISEDALVQPDKATNSLVIIAKPNEIKRLNPIITELDEPRQQVYVEAAILEVGTETSLNLGVNWQAGTDFGGQNVDGGLIGTSNGLPQASILGPGGDRSKSSLGASGFSFGILSFPFTFNGEDFFSLGAFIQASQTDNNVRIISTPQLMTMENQEARVSVGENRPFLTSRERNNAGDEFNNYEYKDIGITLKVTPLINNKGWIKMDIFQEVSRVDPIRSKELAATTPVTRKRTAETTVRVKDGQTTVIAGLMENKTTNVQNKVPGLGDIPGLGYLFKSNEDANKKTNLLVFLTPHIVGDFQAAKKLTYRKSKALNNVRFDLDGGIKPITKNFIRYQSLN